MHLYYVWHLKQCLWAELRTPMRKRDLPQDLPSQCKDSEGACKQQGSFYKTIYEACRLREIMEFGWINLVGIGIIVLIMVPNIIYAVRQKQVETKMKVPNCLLICEQIGRYGCMALMCLPLLVWIFTFESTVELLIYFVGNGVLLLGYYLFWVQYFRKKILANAMALAVIPSLIFLLSGIVLRHWLLVGAAVIFGIAHCRITYLTHKEE